MVHGGEWSGQWLLLLLLGSNRFVCDPLCFEKDTNCLVKS